MKLEKEKESDIWRNILLIKAYQKTKSTFFKVMYYTFSIYFVFQGLELNITFDIIPNIYEMFVPEYVQNLLQNLDLVLQLSLVDRIMAQWQYPHPMPWKWWICYLYGKNNFVGMIKLWDWKIIVDYPGGPHLISLQEPFHAEERGCGMGQETRRTRRDCKSGSGFAHPGWLWGRWKWASKQGMWLTLEAGTAFSFQSAGKLELSVYNLRNWILQQPKWTGNRFFHWASRKECACQQLDVTTLLT